MLSFFFSGERALVSLKSDLKAGGLPGYSAGHSAVNTDYCSMEYLFNILSGGTPKFHEQDLWGGSPYILKAVCGVKVEGKPLPFTKIGVGFKTRHIYNVDKIVEEFLEYKKGLKNAE